MKEQVCLHSLLGPKFSISGDKDIFYPPGTGRIHFTWEIYLLLSGGQKRFKVSFMHGLFLKYFHFKIINIPKWHMLR